MHRKQGRVRGLLNRAIDAVLNQINQAWNINLRRGAR